VGLERAHAKFLRQSEGLPVAGCGIGRSTMSGNLTAQPQGLRLPAVSCMGPAQVEQAVYYPARLLHAAVR